MPKVQPLRILSFGCFSFFTFSFFANCSSWSVLVSSFKLEENALFVTNSDIISKIKAIFFIFRNLWQSYGKNIKNMQIYNFFYGDVSRKVLIIQPSRCLPTNSGDWTNRWPWACQGARENTNGPAQNYWLESPECQYYHNAQKDIHHH